MKETLRTIRDFEIVDVEKDWTYYFDDLNDVRRRIVTDLDLDRRSTFLDVGTGDGWFPISVKQLLKQSTVATIELAANEAENAKRRAIKVGAEHVEFLAMDAYRLGFSDSSFDVVGSFLAIQDICASVEDLTRLLAQISRVLKPRGRVVIATVTPEDAENESQKLGIQVYEFVRAGYFSMDQLTRSLARVGFETEPARFYHTGVNLSPDSALEFVKFQCQWWVDTFQMPTVDWQTTWAKFGPRIIQQRGLEVDAKITVVLGRKKE